VAEQPSYSLPFPRVWSWLHSPIQTIASKAGQAMSCMALASSKPRALKALHLESDETKIRASLGGTHESFLHARDF